MNAKLKYYLTDFAKNERQVSDDLMEIIQRNLGFQLPEDYLEIIKEYGGIEGEVGGNSLLYLYSIEEVIDANNDYKLLMEQIPQYFLIGKDAADGGFAIHKVNGTYHTFGLMSNFKKDPIDFCGSNFSEFLEYLYNN